MELLLMASSKVNREKTAKACKAMKRFGISAETVKAALKCLLEAYENNWMYIEEDDYKVLLDAILEPEGPKTTDIVIHDFKLRDASEEEEDTEIEPLKKKARLRSPTSFSSPAGTSVPYSIYLLENDSSPQNSVEGNRLLALEYKNSDSNENENENVNESQFPSDIDIASSSNGEVKLVISICKPPQGFRIPDFDAVKKQVEDKYRETFQGLGTEFSVSEILNDICTSFMEQGNGSDANNQNHIPTLYNLKEPDKQFDPAGDPVQIPRFVVLSEFTNLPCVNVLSSDGNQKQQMTAIDELSGSSSLSIIPSVEICSSSHYSVADITRGLEKQEISLINEFNDEILPPFSYIQTSFSFKTANVKFMLARISDEKCCSNCFGDCLSPEVPCACAAETGGDFAYTYDGIIKKEFLESSIAVTQNPKTVNYFYCENCPLERRKKMTKSRSCKGHLIRKFIKECWYKCGCGLYCGNRVVQRGIQAKLQIFMTPEGKGWGLRSLEDLPKGTFVCEYVGEIVTNTELFERNEENKDVRHTYPVLLDAGWSSKGFLKEEEALFLDATYYGNVARFINHRCEDANMVDIPVEVESPDHHYYHHAFFTTREVKAMEELTWDYGIDFDDDSHPIKAFKCKCRSKFCKANKYKRRNKRINQEVCEE